MPELELLDDDELAAAVKKSAGAVLDALTETDAFRSPAIWIGALGTVLGTLAFNTSQPTKALRSASHVAATSLMLALSRGEK